MKIICIFRMVWMENFRQEIPAKCEKQRHWVWYEKTGNQRGINFLEWLCVCLRLRGRVYEAGHEA